LAILSIIAWIAASPSGGRLAAQLKPVQTITPLKTAPPPAPVITAWGPQDKVATGEIIWVQGTNLKRDLLVLTLGDRAVLPHLYFEMLPASSSTATRIEFRTSAAMKTGVQTSTPLKILHRGGTPVILDADYHVVDRDARFSGVSRWRKGPTSLYGIYTEGTVTIVLNNLDFANEGSGTYDEEVRLIDQVSSTSEPCPAPLQLFKKTIVTYNWVSVRAQPIHRAISWKRDPAIATRITIYGIGPRAKTNATADLISIEGLQCEHMTGVTGYAPFTREYGCDAPNTVPNVAPASPAHVTFSLRRGI
jgi:hypothetical protein